MRGDMLEVTRLMSALVAAATIAACGGDDDSVTRPTPAISIALSSSALSVTQGATGSASVNLTRSGGFSGDVAITVEGLPGTVTYASAPATIGGNASSAVITFDVAGSATPGGINATVKATGTGVNAATSGLAITVVAAPTYTLAVANATVTATQGGMATQTVNITRTGGFAEGVALTATGLPTGVTAVFDPQSASGNSSTLTLTAAANAPPGNTTVTVNGAATGQADKTATFQLTLNAAPTYMLAIANATVIARRGATATQTVINITRTGGFAGAVALTAEGLPTGVTASFHPQSATGNSSELTLTAAANAATGSATVTVKGTATGQPDRTATFQLAVTAGSPGDFTLAMNPKTLTIQQGTSGTSTVKITQAGWIVVGVWLTATGLPNGVTAVFAPNVTINSSTLTLTASATAATGAATVTIHGRSARQFLDRTTTLALTVNPAVGGSSNTSLELSTVDQTGATIKGAGRGRHYHAVTTALP